MREPLHLRTPLPPDNEDRKLIELQRHRCLPSQIIQEIEHLLSEHRAAEQGIVWAGETYLRNLHDLPRERVLPVIQLIHRELRKAWLFAHGMRFHHHLTKPPPI